MARSILERLKRTRVDMLNPRLDDPLKPTLPFWGLLALRLELREDTQVPAPLATDGTYLLYNPTFKFGDIGTLDQWTDQQLMVGVIHEVAHCALMHPHRKGTHDALVTTGDGAAMPLWLLAVEYPTNEMTMNTGCTLLKGTVWDEKYKGWSAERVYDDLLKQAKQNGSGGYVLKQHGAGCQCVKPANGSKDGDGKASGTSEQDWQQAVRQAAEIAKSRGTLPAGFEQFIENILTPSVDTLSVILEFIQTATDRTDYTWTRPNKAYAYYDTYLPSLEGETCPPFAIFVDTSGSVSDKELATFSGWIQLAQEIYKPERLYVIHCDGAVHKVEVFEQGEPAEVRSFKGRGGTDFAPPFQWIKEHEVEIACAVYLTDLEGPVPDAPSYPVLWVSTTKLEAPWGRTVRLEVPN